MKRMTFVLAFMILLSLPVGTYGVSFQVYPGATVEDILEIKQSDVGKSKIATGHKIIVFTTHDSFERVVTFYRGNAREYRVPGAGRPVKLSSGQELKEAFFILDGASDIMTSTHWVKIQRPYLVRERTQGGFQGKYETVRDITAIIEEDKRSYP